MSLRPLALLPVLVLLAAPAAQAQGVPPPRGGEFGCQVGPTTPCRGKVDFDQGEVYEFRIDGPGTALIQNEGNRRCLMEFSATDSRVATTGRELNLMPGQVLEVAVPDAQGLIMRFTYRGAGSTSCDLLVAVRP